MIGSVYALVNESMPGLIKIGKTSRSVAERAKEVSSSTGVPTPFILAFSIRVSDCATAERIAHGYLENRQQRLTPNREFFCTTLEIAIEAITYANSLLPPIPSELSEIKSPPPPQKTNLEIATELVNSGDIKEGYLRLGDHYIHNSQPKKALEYYYKSTSAGGTEAYERLIDYHSNKWNYAGLHKAFEGLFKNLSLFLDKEINPVALRVADKYIRFCKRSSFTIQEWEHIQFYTPIKEHILEHANKYRYKSRPGYQTLYYVFTELENLEDSENSRDS